MPNPVAVNDSSPISGSLQTSRISYGVETAGKNYGQNYNSSTWYSDIPNNGQFYTIISDNYTANYYISRSNAGGAYVEGGLPAVDEYSAPVFWTTAGTSSLDVITTVNGLPDRVGQIPFNSGSQALNWIASSSNYFAVGPDYYAQIDADNLVLYLEGNQIISYPTTQSTWYDLSGNTNNGTLVNGPAWDSIGYFQFDGTDDYVSINNNSNLVFGNGDFSVSIWIKTPISSSGEGSPSQWGPIVSKGCSTSAPAGTWWLAQNSTNTNRITFNISSTAGGTFVCALTTNTLSDGWHNIVAMRSGSTSLLYQDGVFRTSDTTSDSNLTSISPLFIGTNIASSPKYTNMALSQVSVYNKFLTATEVAQNYYGGPIVTDGLVFAIDAGNLVSYENGSTNTYSLTGSASGSLINGVGFTNSNGGTWVFDGTDDRLPTNFSISGVESTIQISVKPIANSDGYYIAQSAGGADGEGRFLIAASGTLNDDFSLRIGSNTLNTTGGFNQWFILTVTRNSNGLTTFYKNNQIVGTFTNTTPFVSGRILDIGGSTFVSDRTINGSIGNVLIYNRALTPDEVLQNYNATK